MNKKAILTVQQWGNSLAVRIPAALARSACFAAGQPVESSKGWGQMAVIVTLVLALLTGALFVVLELHHPAPMLPLHLFKSRNFSGANPLTLLLYAALGGGLYFLPLNLIQVQAYSALAAGAALLPFVMLMFALSRWSGGLVARHGAKLPLVIGPAIASLGFAGFALSRIDAIHFDHYWLDYFPPVLLLGPGMAITVAPLTTTVMNAVGADFAGAASGINNVVSRTGALLAIAVFGVVMNFAFNATLERNLPALKLAPELVQAVASQRGVCVGDGGRVGTRQQMS